MVYLHNIYNSVRATHENDGEQSAMPKSSEVLDVEGRRGDLRQEKKAQLEKCNRLKEWKSGMLSLPLVLKK